VSDLRPFAIARPGVPLPGADGVRRVDPLAVASAPLLAGVEQLDARAGRASPRWVLFDCAELPGAVVGLARPDGPPVAMVAATPTIEPDHWFLHGLCALHEPHLGEVLDLALRLLRPARVSAAAPWGSAALAAYAARGPLRLTAACAPLHAGSCAFELAPGARPRGAPWVAEPVALQRAIEDGARVLVRSDLRVDGEAEP
jgi:hypothetical protein